MTKQEIYDHVVRYTSKIKKTGIAQRICWALSSGNAESINTLFDAFPMYYPGIYNQVCAFGHLFNSLVGDDVIDIEKSSRIMQDCGFIMYALAKTEIISHIANADAAGDDERVLALIKEFNEQNPYFVGNLISFQRAFSEYQSSCPSGKDGEIFGLEENIEEEIFVFDEKKIDPMSFFVFTIIANIRIPYFFYRDDDNKLSLEAFEDAIGNMTNVNFAHFVTSFYAFDFIGYKKNYQTIGDILVDAYNYYLCEEE